ncbi:MAG TPA: oligosaccharide flippase family protein, partial [Kofleriaceae bacterium]|nr:oligosaccharide flippase family protein [Kofleriaceae bacterium]
ELRFRGSFAIQAGGSAIGAAVTIGGALGGMGIWALIGGELASALAQSSLALALGWRHWRPRLRFARHDLRGPLGTGMYQVGERAANLFATNIDYVVVGRVLGAEALALYAVAFELTSLPARLNQVVTRVAFPVLSRRQDDPDGFRRGYFELMRVVALVQLPLIVGIGVLAPLLVPVFFGADWAPAIPLVEILALFGAFRALGNPSGPVFLARGRADIGFHFNLVVAPVALAAFALAAPHGAEAVAWSWVALGAAQLAALVVVQGNLVRFAARDWLAAIARPALIAALAAGFLVAARALAQALPVPDGVRLLVAVAVAGAALAPAAWKLEGPFLRSWLAVVRQGAVAERT